MTRRFSLQQKLNQTSHENTQAKIKEKIEEIETGLKTSMYEQQRSEENQAVENAKGNPKYFFSYANKRLQTLMLIFVVFINYFYNVQLLNDLAKFRQG